MWDRKSDAWLECVLQLEIDEVERHRYATIYSSTSSNTLKKVLLEITSYVLETNLAENSFEIVTVYAIAHFSCPNITCCRNWIAILKQFIAKCDPYPTDSLIRETLQRYPGISYTVKFTEKKPLGIAFEKSGEWANVKISQHPVVTVGSVLSAINGDSSSKIACADVLLSLGRFLGLTS